MDKSSAFDTARVVIAGLIVALAFAVFMLFYKNSESIFQNGFYSFITLVVIGFSLLIVLLYLVNNSGKARVRVGRTTRSSVKKHKSRR